jgi:hypothetical protein
MLGVICLLLPSLKGEIKIAAGEGVFAGVLAWFDNLSVASV